MNSLREGIKAESDEHNRTAFIEHFPVPRVEVVDADGKGSANNPPNVPDNWPNIHATLRMAAARRLRRGLVENGKGRRNVEY